MTRNKRLNLCVCDIKDARVHSKYTRAMGFKTTWFESDGFRIDLPSLSYIAFFDQNEHDVNKKN